MNVEIHDFVRALCPGLSPTKLALAQQRLVVFLNFNAKMSAEFAGLPPPPRLDIPFEPEYVPYQGDE